ncbi:OmpA family protein [Brachyspira innocens]|uniref:OmpA family protein n=1 Tax=Brachyspira innocens TaxID=13264 RepID=A0ABT8YU06_9SPIR|nr:OmpA family protein [Brachyspira innocens]MDO6993518.1 OmpA family protein [Brachyspira innocens]MDO7019259.1 OmpA family protein [Brachyspira innocens]
MKKILFIFTLLIFVIACKSTPKNSTPEDVVIAEEPAPVAVSEEKTTELYLPENTSIRETDRGRILETNPKIIFKLVETDMPETTEMSFDQVIEFLNKNTNANIILEAHTSNRGIAYPYNYNLSVVRAKNGKKYLTDKGVDPNRVIESPLGEALPEYPTQDALRRYEFVIIENEDDMVKYSTYISQLDVRQESTYQGN